MPIAPYRRLKRFGYTTCNITVSDLIGTRTSGCDLFRKLCSSEHSPHHLLIPVVISDLSVGRYQLKHKSGPI